MNTKLMRELIETIEKNGWNLEKIKINICFRVIFAEKRFSLGRDLTNFCTDKIKEFSNKSASRNKFSKEYHINLYKIALCLLMLSIMSVELKDKLNYLNSALSIRNDLVNKDIRNHSGKITKICNAYYCHISRGNYVSVSYNSYFYRLDKLILEYKVKEVDDWKVIEKELNPNYFAGQNSIVNDVDILLHDFQDRLEMERWNLNKKSRAYRLTCDKSMALFSLRREIKENIFDAKKILLAAKNNKSLVVQRYWRGYLFSIFSCRYFKSSTEKLLMDSISCFDK